MATNLVVRNIEPSVAQALKAAARHGRSAEAEHREILRRRSPDRHAEPSGRAGFNARRRDRRRLQLQAGLMYPCSTPTSSASYAKGGRANAA